MMTYDMTMMMLMSQRCITHVPVQVTERTRFRPGQQCKRFAIPAADPKSVRRPTHWPVSVI